MQTQVKIWAQNGSRQFLRAWNKIKSVCKEWIEHFAVIELWLGGFGWSVGRVDTHSVLCIHFIFLSFVILVQIMPLCCEICCSIHVWWYTGALFHLISFHLVLVFFHWDFVHRPFSCYLNSCSAGPAVVFCVKDCLSSRWFSCAGLGHLRLCLLLSWICLCDGSRVIPKFYFGNTLNLHSTAVDTSLWAPWFIPSQKFLDPPTYANHSVLHVYAGFWTNVVSV